MGILDFIKNNLDKILIGIGLLAVIFWPKIKAALSEVQGGTDAPASSPSKQPNGNCCCCEPDEPAYDEEADKSEWVVSTMRTRAYCVDHRLEEGVKLCEQLVGVLVAAKPTKKTLVVTREVK